MAIIFKPERITEANRLNATRKPADGELIVATTGSAFGSNRCNIYIGDGSTQLKSLKPCIVGTPPLKWVSTLTNMGKGASTDVFTYWDSDTSNYYLRMIVIMAHIGPDSDNKNILLTITVPDPINGYTMDGGRTLRAGYYMTTTGNGTVAFTITKSTTEEPKKFIITHDTANTYINGLHTYDITWVAKALYQYEKYKTPL